MLNSEKKIRALPDKKNNILTLVLSENFFLNETKNHNPPFKLNGRSLIPQYFRKGHEINKSLYRALLSLPNNVWRLIVFAPFLIIIILLFLSFFLSFRGP